MAAANAAPAESVALVPGKAIEIMKTNRGVAGLPYRLESVHDGKADPISVDGENGALAETATMIRCPVQGVARENQSVPRTDSVAVGIVTGRISAPGGETIQVRKTRPIQVDGEDRASARTAAERRRPVPDVAV